MFSCSDTLKCWYVKNNAQRLKEVIFFIYPWTFVWVSDLVCLLIIDKLTWLCFVVSA